MNNPCGKKDGHTGWHKSEAAIQRARAKTAQWRKDNPGRLETWKEENTDLVTRQRRRATLRKYNLTLEDYEILLDKQEGRCAICGRFGGDKLLAVDHDHACCPAGISCGKCIRGLLCEACNQALGLFGDNPDVLRSAIEYLTPTQKFDTVVLAEMM